MADQRDGGISWTNETWNVVRGCTRVSEGCRNCYAERRAAVRMSKPGQAYHGLAKMTPAGPRWTGKIKLVESLLDQPSRWHRPRLIFVNAMSDLFHEGLTDEQIDRVVLAMAAAPWHTFQVLTKRPARMASYLAQAAGRLEQAEPVSVKSNEGPWEWPLCNVWWGTSAEDQESFDARIGHLLSCRANAAVLWLSLEPLIGPIARPGSLYRVFESFIDWVVVGGESGPGARPMYPGWARSLRDDCAAAGVPFHFKQWGEWAPGENVERDSGMVDAVWLTDGEWTHGRENLYLSIDDRHVDDEPDLYRIGKKAAGRLLDGVLHDAMPAAR